MSDKNKKFIYSFPIYIFSTNIFIIDNFIENYLFFSEPIPTNLIKKNIKIDEKLSGIVEIDNQNYLINFKTNYTLNNTDFSIFKNISLIFFLLDVSDYTNFQSLIKQYVKYMVNEKQCNFKGPIYILGLCDKDELEGIETDSEEILYYLNIIDYKNFYYKDLTNLSSDKRFIAVNEILEKLIKSKSIKLNNFSNENCSIF
jgi:hypothetical protein